MEAFKIVLCYMTEFFLHTKYYLIFSIVIFINDYVIFSVYIVPIIPRLFSINDLPFLRVLMYNFFSCTYLKKKEKLVYSGKLEVHTH